MFMAVPGHFADGVIMGYYAGKAKLAPNERQARLYLVRALAFPILLHGAYNFSLMQGRPPALVFGALCILALALKISSREVKELQEDSKSRFGPPSSALQTSSTSKS